MSTTTLLTNPTSVGDIFFSGSQEVSKGNQVTWILDDIWAFKTTEPCGVSTNASPFVQLQAGQTFIIYKRTQADIDAGNSKGIYVFDRDTVVALAYPQEVSQYINIENDIYNNNLSTINVEADKTPVAVITLSEGEVSVGTPVTVYGTNSYSIDPATLVSYSWTKNGAIVSTASSWTYTPDTVRKDNITLVITDSEGRKSNTVATVNVIPAPVYEDILVEKGGVSIDNMPERTETVHITAFNSPISVVGDVNVTVSIPVESVLNSSTARVRIYKNGTLVTHNDTWIGGNSSAVCLCIYEATEAVLSTDDWTATLQEVGGDAREYDTGIFAGTGQYSLATLKVTNRTA